MQLQFFDKIHSNWTLNQSTSDKIKKKTDAFRNENHIIWGCDENLVRLQFGKYSSMGLNAIVTQGAWFGRR